MKYKNIIVMYNHRFHSMNITSKLNLWSNLSGKETVQMPHGIFIETTDPQDHFLNSHRKWNSVNSVIPPPPISIAIILKKN